MIKRNDFTQFLNTYLAIEEVHDICWNGLQFEGRDEVAKVALAVDASIESFMAATHEHADFLITHHGHFWDGANPSLVGWSKKRFDHLYQHQLSLYAAHGPLDRHKEVGNNAQLLRLIGAEITGEFMIRDGKNIGWIGTLRKPTVLSDLEQKLSQSLNAKIQTLSFGPEKVQTIAVCSGGGGYHGFSEALASKVDLYISGDAVDITSTAKDAGINVIFAGHNRTEIVGLLALEKVIQKKFKIETVFLELPTGL